MGNISEASPSYEDLSSRLDAALMEHGNSESGHLLNQPNAEQPSASNYGTINNEHARTSNTPSLESLSETRRATLADSIETTCNEHDIKTRHAHIQSPSAIMRERQIRQARQQKIDEHESKGSATNHDISDIYFPFDSNYINHSLTGQNVTLPPEYGELGNDLPTIIAELKKLCAKDPGTFPITNAAVDLDGSTIGWDILFSFYSALSHKGDEIVALFIESGLVTANTKDAHGTTPLLMATNVGNVRMVQQLLDFDASINDFGIPPHGAVGRNPKFCTCTSKSLSPRTPLMLAAELGNLTLVKLFMEVYGANDALIATDGQIALRLAADNQHREIVNYLPARRGGGWRRWKKEHVKAMTRVKKAGEKIYTFGKILVWEVPKIFLYYLPTELAKWLWEHRTDIPRWLWEFLQEIPKTVWRVLKWLARIPRGIPNATVVVAKFVWKVLQTIGRSTVHVGKATFSFLHTLITAIVSFFRSLTLKDLWNGLLEIFKLPLRLWNLLEELAKAIVKCMKALFGFTGVAVTWLFFGIVWVIVYVPRKLWDIVASMGSSLGKAFKELLVLMNPRMA
jgi:hypothetical protein